MDREEVLDYMRQQAEQQSRSLVRRIILFFTLLLLLTMAGMVWWLTHLYEHRTSSGGVPAAIVNAGRAYASEWCNPQSYGSYSNGSSTVYHCVPDTKSPHPDRMGHVEEDTKFEAVLLQEEAHKRELELAMTTRVLTKDEYMEVLQAGSTLLTRNGQPYYPNDVDQRFEHMLRIQDELRITEMEARERERTRENKRDTS